MFSFPDIKQLFLFLWHFIRCTGQRAKHTLLWFFVQSLFHLQAGHVSTITVSVFFVHQHIGYFSKVLVGQSNNKRPTGAIITYFLHVTLRAEQFIIWLISFSCWASDEDLEQHAGRTLMNQFWPFFFQDILSIGPLFFLKLRLKSTSPTEVGWFNVSRLRKQLWVGKFTLIY